MTNVCLFIQPVARASVYLTVKQAVNLTCHDETSIVVVVGHFIDTSLSVQVSFN